MEPDRQSLHEYKKKRDDTEEEREETLEHNRRDAKDTNDSDEGTDRRACPVLP